MQRYGFLLKTPNVPQSFLLQKYESFLESQLLKSSKIFVIFFQNAIFLDEMGKNESDKLKIKNEKLKLLHSFTP